MAGGREWLGRRDFVIARTERTPVAATLISVKSDVPAGVRVAGSQPAFSDHPLLAEKPSLLKRALGVFLRYLVVIGIGIGGTLAWQAYGGDAKQMVANWVAQRGWPVTWLSKGEAGSAGPASTAAMVPPSQAVVQPAPADTEAVAPIAPETKAQTARLERLEAISADLSAMRERIEQMAVGQEQMASDIAKLRTAEQEIRQKISTAPRAAAALPSKPRAPSSPPLPQPMPLH
jgi:hypothetical protein